MLKAAKMLNTGSVICSFIKPLHSSHYLCTQCFFLMKVATQKLAMFPRRNNALSLNADAAWPTLDLTGHVNVNWTSVQNFHRILTNL